jgi:hypothetical protein
MDKLKSIMKKRANYLFMMKTNKKKKGIYLILDKFPIFYYTMKN